MGEAVLVNRKKFVSSLANELVEPFEEICGKGPLTMGETGRFRLFSPFFPCASRGDVLE